MANLGLRCVECREGDHSSNGELDFVADVASEGDGRIALAEDAVLADHHALDILQSDLKTLTL